GRYAVQAMKHMEPQVKQALQSLPKSAFSRYYRGGFEPKMSKREACLILGVSPTANKSKIREAHRKIMVLNHPDRGTVCPLYFKQLFLSKCKVLLNRVWGLKRSALLFQVSCYVVYLQHLFST
ncbi:TIM14 translocase, partial [Polyodon spathula]|nr:TIM14 translocase [Polyodon spathula]